MSDLGGLLDDARVVVCCGTGGVGKTTVAAALGLAAARRGRRVAVVTIDPARRLADALGVGALTNEPQHVSDALVGGRDGGALWASMLDARATFDALVARHAPSTAQRDRTLANPFYRNVADRLSGTQEYMAAEKLYELTNDERFDLVIVDTPPARNAIDFLDAPERLARFLDHRVYRALMLPARGYLKAVSAAGQMVLRPIAKVIGAEVVTDVMAFFQNFDGMEAGFRTRSAAVAAELRATTTRYVLVAAPRTDLVAEATWFAERLRAMALPVSALVVNRVHPSFGDDAPIGAVVSPSPAPADGRRAQGGPLAPWHATLAEQRQVARAEAAQVTALAAVTAPAVVVTVPLRPTDVHDLASLAELAGHLAAGLSTGLPAG